MAQSKDPNKNYCIRVCYYQEKYWEEGECIEDTPGFEDCPPNKHFAKGGIVKEADRSNPTVPGDDRRSTNQLLADLKEKYKIVIEPNRKETRKEAFYKWVEAEKVKKPSKKATRPNDEGKSEGEDPLNGKKFSEMTPDDIEELKVKDIHTAILLRHKMDVKYGGKSKVDLVTMGMDIEAKQTGARAI